MSSGLLHGPVAMLRAASSVPIPAAEGRVAGNVMADTDTLIIVVAGARGAGKSSLVNALIGAPPLAPVPDPVAAGDDDQAAHVPARPSRPAAASQVSSYLLFRHGRRPIAYAYIPGHREPRRIPLDELATADVPPLAGGGQTRPPRRVEVNHPGELLRRLSLLDTPGFGALDPAYREVVLDAAERGGGLLFVTGATQPFEAAELDLLVEAAHRGVPVVFAMTGIDTYPRWRETVVVNRAWLAQRAGELLAAPWFGLDARAGQGRSDAGTGGHREDAAAEDPVADGSGTAGVGEGIQPLREALLTLTVRTARDDGRQAPPGRPLAAVTVPPQTTDASWQEVLDRQVRARRVTALQRLAIDLATIHVRCVQELGGGLGCARLPHALDRELHALSVRTTRYLDSAAREIANRVFAEVIDTGSPAVPDAAAQDAVDEVPLLDPAVMERVMRAIRRTLESGDASVPDTDRVLLLTATSGVAVVSGAGSLAGLAAVGAGRRDRPVMREIGLGLTAGCYLMWQQRIGNKGDCRRWLQQAIQVVEGELQREVGQRFADLQEAVATLAADTVDHGVLLA